MRTTLVFFALLVFVSCSSSMLTPEQAQNAFVELNKDPRADAVFATMAVHLKAKKGGFNLILSLLTELVSNARKQDHQNTLIWRGTQAHCHVGIFGLTERQDFFEGTVKSMIAFQREADVVAAQTQNLLASRRRCAARYTNVLKRIEASYKREGVNVHGKVDFLKEAASRTNAAIKAVTDWHPKVKPAFIQTSIEAAAKAYQNAVGLKITVPTNLLQSGGNDKKVKNRLLEWLGDLQALLEGAQQGLGVAIHARLEEMGENSKRIRNFIKAIKNDAKNLVRGVHAAVEVAKHTKKAVAIFRGLAAKNRVVLAKAKKWCAVERTNYLRAHKACVAQLKVFIEVRDYFVDHYQKLSSYIMNKYH